MLVGLMGWFVPQALGVGYSYVGDALNNHMALKLMALLVVLKLFGVTVSYASGNAGGIFGPALFLGAMLGGTVGSVAHHFYLLPRPCRELMRWLAWARCSRGLCARR